MALRTKPRAALVHARSSAARHVLTPLRTELDWMASRCGRADLALFHEFAPPPYGGGNQFLRALVGRARAPRALGRGEPDLRRDPACLFNSFNFDFRRLRRFAAPRRAHRAPRRRADRRLSRVRRRHGRADRRDQRELADATIVQSRFSLDAHRELGIELRDPVVDPERRRSGDLPSAGHARAARGPQGASHRDELVGQSRARVPTILEWLDRNLDRGALRADASSGACPSTFERIRVARPGSARSRRRRASRRTTSTSRRAATTRARTRCSRRSRAGFRPPIRASGGHPELVGDARTRRSTSRRSSPTCSTGSSSELDERRAAIRVPAARRGRGPLSRGAARMSARARCLATLAARSAVSSEPASGARTRGGRALRLFAVGERRRLVGRRGRGHLEATARRLGYDVAPSRWARFASAPGRLPHEPLRGAAAPLARVVAPARARRTSTDGPGRPGIPSSTTLRGAPPRSPTGSTAIQVTHAEMHELVLEAGVDPSASSGSRSGSTSSTSRSATPEQRCACARVARTCRRRVRRRLVPEGRRRLGRGARAEARSRARTSSSPRSSASRASPRAASCCSPGRRAATSAASSSGSASRIATSWRRTRRELARGVPRARRLRRRVARRRAARRQCSSRWRRAYRSSRRASGRLRTSSTTARTVSSSTSTTSTALAARSRAFATIPTSCPRFVRAGRATAEQPRVRAPRSRWAALLDGFVERGVGHALEPRVERYARAAARWARLLAPGRQAAGTPRVLRPRPRARARASRSPAERRRSRGSPSASRTPRRTSRCSTSASTWLPRDLRPLLWVARRRGIPIVVNQDGVGYPGWAGDRTDELNRPLRRALLSR